MSYLIFFLGIIFGILLSFLTSAIFHLCEDDKDIINVLDKDIP